MSLVSNNEYVDFELLVSKAEQFIERRSPSALPLAEQIMQLAQASDNPKHYAQARYVFAFYNCLVMNDYDKAIQYCEEVISELDENEAPDLFYKLYMTMGNSYQLKGETFMAQECYLKGLKQLEAKSSLSKTEKGFLASFYYNLFLVFGTTELNMSSEEYLDNAINIYQEIDSGFKLSKCYVAYAGVFEKKKDYSKAIEMLHKSLAIDTRLNDPYSIALSKANLGILHLSIRDFETAFPYINDSLDYYKNSEMVYETALVKMNLGEALCLVGKLEEGLQELYDAEELFTKLDNKRDLATVYDSLSKHLDAYGNYKAALGYQRKYTESLKYFFNVEKTRAITRAKKEFESEQKEKEAVILREKNEEINHYVIKLESSNNALKQFAHVASHDLREPLRMITAYISLLQKSMSGALSAQQAEFMAFAVDGAKRLDQMIADMLRLAKVDANPRTEKIKCGALIEEVKMNLEVLIQEKKAVVMESQLPAIMADRTMLLQLFQNLIGNGIKYNESPAPVVKVMHRRVKEGVEITISDNGIGIPEHLRIKAFQLFQRLNTGKNYSGSGIGLAICKKIVESMSGKINIEDNPTGGTIFKIVFPLSVLAGE